MKNPFTLPPKNTLLHALQSLLFGVGVSYPLLAALDLPVSFALCAACCALAALGFFLLHCVKRVHGLFYPLLMLGMFAPFIPYMRHPLGNALTLFLSGQPLALAPYARTIAILVSLMTTGIGVSLSRSEQSFFPTVMLTIGVLLAVSFSGAHVAAGALFPLLLAVLLSARAQGVTALRLIPHVALVALITALTLPYAGSTVPLLEETAQRVRQAIDDYFFFNDARTAFSLSSTGWQPLGSERLGGPVAPEDTPVMQVKTGGRALLRGIIKNEYTGASWQDTTSGRRYLFVNPRFSALKDDLFDFSRPRGELRDALPEHETISVTMRADAASTLFLTQRFLSPKGEGIVAYFSPASEVFATHSLTMGESYTFSGSRLTSESQGVRQIVLDSLDAQDPYLDTVRERYLSLPGGVSPQVASLAQDICTRLDNDYDRAAAICLHLQNAYPYTLLQSEPPADRDFVSWFLFEEQKGYCTSFASAMAVMCRAMGIPARYIEGYAATPDADGIARVTQQNAHAWVEVYFPGFGWLSFDPTPGIGQAPDTSSAPGGDQGGQPTPTPPEGGEGGDPSPTPTATPQPSPTPLPTPTPEHDDPAVTPTPEITPTPAPTERPTPLSTPPEDDPDDPQSPRLLAILLAALLLLLLVALIVWRLYAAAPANAVRRMRLTNDALLGWYAAIEEALLCLGIVSAPGEAPATFLSRAQEQLSGKPQLMRLGRAVCAARFSRHKLSGKQVEHAQGIYDALLRQMTPLQCLRMYARRLVRGPKMYRQ